MRYITVTPDMLSGFAPDGGGTRFFPTMWMAGSFMTVLPNETVKAELDTWTDYALKPPGVDGKLGIAGLS